MTLPAVAASLALFAAVLALTRVNAVHALLMFLAALLALAVTFLSLGAAFAAALTVVVYAGAVVVVFVFVAMTLDSSADAIAGERRRLGRAGIVPFGVGGAVLLVLTGLLLAGPVSDAAQPVPSQAVGQLLFGGWVLAVEIASFLLLAGLIAARHLGGEEASADDGDGG